MERASKSGGVDLTQAGSQRAGKLRTRKHAELAAQRERERDQTTGFLSQNEYWAKHVRSEADIVEFYRLYHPEYPEILQKAIAKRISGIIEKSRTGEQLTEAEKDYVRKSQKPREDCWDPKEEMKAHDLQARVNIATKQMSELIRK